MKTLLLPLFVIFQLIAQSVRAQNQDYLKYCPDTNSIKLIDKSKLISKMTQSEKPIQLVLIYTNNCGGTIWALENIAKLNNKYPDKINFILCSSANEKNQRKMAELCVEHEVPLDTVYIIDGTKYKNDLEDEREKGFLFRNDICKECQKDNIGVPYHLIFDNSGRLLKAGFFFSKEIDSIIQKQLEQTTRN